MESFTTSFTRETQGYTDFVAACKEILKQYHHSGLAHGSLLRHGLPRLAGTKTGARDLGNISRCGFVLRVFSFLCNISRFDRSILSLIWQLKYLFPADITAVRQSAIPSNLVSIVASYDSILPVCKIRSNIWNEMKLAFARVRFSVQPRFYSRFLWSFLRVLVQHFLSLDLK